MKNGLWKELLWISGLSTTSGLLIGWSAKWLQRNTWELVSVLVVFIVVAISFSIIRLWKENDRHNVSLGERELFLGNMDTVNCSKLFFEILRLNRQSNQPIKLFIDSAGGELNGFRILANGIKSSKAPVIGVVIGNAHSAAALILQCCHKRIAMPYTRIFFHEIQNTINTNLSGANVGIIENVIKKLLQERKQARNDQNELDDLITTRSGISFEQIESIEEKYLTPKEALKLNLIDEIATII